MPDSPTGRFTSDHVAAWRRDGGVLIPGFFTAGEVQAVVADFERVFGRTQGAQEAMIRKGVKRFLRR